MTPSNNENVLIVEDNDDIRVLTKMILEREGYVVAVAVNGQEALDMIPKLPKLKAIFLDLNMPVMGGKEFLKIRQEKSIVPNVPVIIFAAVREQEVLAGVAEWIRKPVDLDGLLRVAQKYLS